MILDFSYSPNHIEMLARQLQIRLAQQRIQESLDGCELLLL
jgi:hypothetical protein